MGKADIHVHSACGDGMDSVEQILDYADRKTDLTVVAITDHDVLKGGDLAREVKARGNHRVDVVAGEEVTTLQGHLLALFIEEPVAPLKPLAETLEAIHRQGGLCVIPHPLNWLTRSIGHRSILSVMTQRGSGIYFDGIQMWNVAPGSRVKLSTARRLNKERYHLPELGGSDAHFVQAVGSAYTLFEGESAEDLRRSILAGTTSGGEGRYPSLKEIGYGRFLRQQYRGILVTPKAAGWKPTIWSFFKRLKP